MGSSNTPTAVAVPIEIVEVVAPADLKAGYTFMAIYQGVTFPVTVPDGGVKEGQRLKVPFEPVSSEMTPLTSGTDDAPRGAWKDGLCDCLKYGCCHPSFLNALCFPQILMAQAMTRLKMNLLAEQAPEHEWKNTFSRMIMIVVAYWIVSSVLAPPTPVVEKSSDGTISVLEEAYPLWERLIYNVVTTGFALYSLIIMIRLRAAVRRRYEIPEKYCPGMEDCCCAFLCGCCTVAQIARQTTDYDQTRATCCSSTGLPTTSEVVVV